MNPLAPIERFLRFLTNIPNVLFSLAGALFVASGIVLAALIASKEAAVAVAVSGTFIGTALMSLFVPKAIYTMKQKEIERAAKDSQSKELLYEEQRKHLETARQLADEEREISRLESMRINLDAFRSVMKLGLLDLDMQITDFRKQRLKTDEESWFAKEKNLVYVGAVRIPIKAQLGIDLAELRLWQDGNTLLVSNIVPSHVIDTCGGAQWELDEVRVESLKDGRVVQVESNPSDPRAKDEARKHEAQVRGRLKEGQEFKQFESCLAKVVEQALSLFLAPIGKEITFAPAGSTSGEPIQEFLRKHKEELRNKIEERRASLKSSS
jgi:hypothetical protein